MFNAWHPAGLAGLVAINVLSVSVILVVPFLLAGAIFPLTLIGAGRKDRGATASAVGRLYAVNTAGAILGSVLAGFVMVPWIGSRGTLLAITLLMAILAVACALATRRRRLV